MNRRVSHHHISGSEHLGVKRRANVLMQPNASKFCKEIFELPRVKNIYPKSKKRDERRRAKSSPHKCWKFDYVLMVELVPAPKIVSFFLTDKFSLAYQGVVRHQSDRKKKCENDK